MNTIRTIILISWPLIGILSLIFDIKVTCKKNVTVEWLVLAIVLGTIFGYAAFIISLISFIYKHKNKELF